MYINPFWAGVTATLFVEFAIFLIIAFVYDAKTK